MNSEPSLNILPTRDEGLLTQYFDLRERQYHRHFPSLPPGFGRLEPDDETSAILAATLGDRVVGGARLSFVNAGTTGRLPLESADFKLRDALPDWHLEARTICEFGRHAINPDFGRLVAGPLALEMARTAARGGAALAFTVCPPAQAVLNRRHCRHIGLEFELFPYIAPPNPFGLLMNLCVYRGLEQFLQL